MYLSHPVLLRGTDHVTELLVLVKMVRCISLHKITAQIEKKMIHILMHTVLTVFLYYTLLILSLHCREYIGLCGFSILLSSVLLKTRQGATYSSCLLRAITILRRVSLQHPFLSETVL